MDIWLRERTYKIKIRWENKEGKRKKGKEKGKEEKVVISHCRVLPRLVADKQYTGCGINMLISKEQK